MNNKEAQPRVSIVLATYNGATFLPALLDSLQLQSLPPAEIIVCDDQSQDDTLAILSRYANSLPIQVHVNPESLGVVGNFQRGVSLCSGDYIAFCDQDDVWLPNKLAQSVLAMSQVDAHKPGLVFTDLVVVDQQLNVIADSYWRHRGLMPQKETFATLLYGNFITGCTMLINKQMAIEVAHMPADVLMHDFWIGCIAYSVDNVLLLETPDILYRQHTTNVTTNDKITWQSRFERLLKFVQNSDQARLFLMPEIKQAETFLRLYDNELGPEKKKEIKNFIYLRHKKPLYRKWQALIVKFFHLSPSA